MAALFVLSNVIRYWVIYRFWLELWNIQIMDSGRVGIVTSGAVPLGAAPELCRRGAGGFLAADDPYGLDHVDRQLTLRNHFEITEAPDQIRRQRSTDGQSRLSWKRWGISRSFFPRLFSRRVA